MSSDAKTYYNKSSNLVKNKNTQYSGPGIAGYYSQSNYDSGSGRLPHYQGPTVYDGLLYDNNMYQTYDSTVYVAGLVACVTLFTVGIIFMNDVKPI